MGGCRLGLAARIRRSRPRPSWLIIGLLPIPWRGSARCAVSSMKIDGDSLIEISSDSKRLTRRSQQAPRRSASAEPQHRTQTIDQRKPQTTSFNAHAR